MKVRSTTSTVTLALAVLLALPAAAAPVPADSDMAVSVNLGLADAFDSDLEDLERVLTGTFEFYTAPRISWRGLVGVTSFEADVPGRPDVDVKFVNANVVYNWEKGKFHPFVTGGVGHYDRDASFSFPGRSGSDFGVNAGGGVDWYFGPRWGLKFEGALHELSGDGPDSFFLATAGVKFWF